MQTMSALAYLAWISKRCIFSDVLKICSVYGCNNWFCWMCWMNFLYCPVPFSIGLAASRYHLHVTWLDGYHRFILCVSLIEKQCRIMWWLIVAQNWKIFPVPRLGLKACFKVTSRKCVRFDSRTGLHDRDCFRPVTKYPASKFCDVDCAPSCRYTRCMCWFSRCVSIPIIIMLLSS